MLNCGKISNMNVQNQATDTIVALSTAQGIGAISIVRLSGSKSIYIAKQIVRQFPQKAGQLCKCEVLTDTLTDDAMCVYFVSPKSFTGEDVVEFHLHGGHIVSSCVINKCISQGARLALNGEYSKRAFINGKLNLTNTEGIIDIITAENTLAVRNGHLLLVDELTKLIDPILAILINISAIMEVSIDYPDEDIVYDKNEATKLINECQQVVDKLLSTQQKGGFITKGVNVAIVGRTNAGKSSLLNSLIGSDRVIVSDIAGTTRDTVEVSQYINGIKFNFIDTAGLRETTDNIEKLGIQRTNNAISNADILIVTSDIYPLSEIDKDLINKSKRHIVVLNKCDINDYPTAENYIKTSAKLNIGINELKSRLCQLVENDIVANDELVLTNSRHIDILTRCRQALQQVIENLNNTYDIVLLYISEAIKCLNELNGKDSTQQVIDEIFSKFCLGK